MSPPSSHSQPAASTSAAAAAAQAEARPLLASNPGSPHSDHFDDADRDADDERERRHGEDHDEDEDGDEDEEAGQPRPIPFPRQTDPSRRFRPPHYRSKRTLSKLHSWVDRNTGFLLLALAQVFYATMALFFKILNDLPPLPPSEKGEGAEKGGRESQSIGALQVIVVRMAVTALGCYLYLIFIARDPHPFLGPPAVRKLLAFRGFSGFFGLFGLYFSLQYLSLADATCITFLSPLATALLAAPLLNEPLHARQLVAGIVSVVGVTLIARPQFLFGRTPGGGDELGDGPVPGGDEGGGIGDGQALLQQLVDLAALASSPSGGGGGGENAGAAAVAAVGPIAGPLGAIVAQAAATASDAVASSAHALLATATPRALVDAVTATMASATSPATLGVVTAATTAAAAATTTATSPASQLASSPPQPTELQRVVAVGIALLGVLGSAGAYTSLRCIGTRASPTHSVAYFSTYSFAVAGLGMLLTGQPFILPSDVRWALLMLLIGLCGLCAQILAAMGLAREKAGRATVAVYLQAPITVFYQIVLLHTPLEPLSAMGSGIILLASVWVSMGRS